MGEQIKDEWLVIVESDDYDSDWIIWAFDNIVEAEQQYNDIKNKYPQTVLTKVIKQYAK